MRANVLLSFLSVATLAALISGCGARKGKDVQSVGPDGRAVHAITVDAKQHVTLVGQFKQGAKVDIEPKGGAWSARPGMTPVGPEGQSGTLCLDDGDHHCIGGDGTAPLMGLLVIMSPCPIEQTGCQMFGRDYVSGPITITVPRDGFMYLAPNDWREAIGDNSGSVQVDVTY
jgi:hypothetical protein